MTIWQYDNATKITLIGLPIKTKNPTNYFPLAWRLLRIVSHSRILICLPVDIIHFISAHKIKQERVTLSSSLYNNRKGETIGYTNGNFMLLLSWAWIWADILSNNVSFFINIPRHFLLFNLCSIHWWLIRIIHC